MTTEASEAPTAAGTMTVEELRAQTRLLAGELPGTLRRITLRAGAPAPAAPQSADAPVEDAAPAGLVQVTAPLVGTYYQAPSPGAEPFVQVGDIVEPGTQLAVVEAMKLLNSITADVRGRVHAVHARDGEVVEYAQPLIDLVPVD
jgi:acetyl-CoA carboxylase biotin carboxyl carrier protein